MKYQLLIIPISSPILVGLYEDNKLIKTISSQGKTSDILPEIIDDILKEKSIDEVYFVNGPGSYMAIKVAYIFLKTFTQIKKIPFYACSGFELNENSPIKALGKKYFYLKEDKSVDMRFLNEDEILKEFKLPEVIDKNIFFNDTLPNYYLPVVT